MDLSSFETWENLNQSVSDELKASSELQIRCYLGLASGVFEIALGIAQFYSHKRSVALVTGHSPHLHPILPYLYKEGYQVQIAPETFAAKEWVESLAKDTCFAILCEDHAVSGELYETEEIEKLLNEKRIFCLKVSHHNHLFRQTELLPYSVRLCSFDPKTAVALIGSKMRAPALIAPFLEWEAPQFLASLQKAKAESVEKKELVLNFEKNLPAGFSAFLQTSQRCFDRALIYSESLAGEALQQFLASSLKLNLRAPGWETRLETTHLCRWGGVRNYDEWWKPRPAESILRGLLILGIEVLEHPDLRATLDKALRECQIADLS